MVKTGRIYLIRCPAGVGRYAGSTESPGRMHSHRSSCKADPTFVLRGVTGRRDGVNTLTCSCSSASLQGWT